MADLLLRDTDRDELIADIADAVVQRLRGSMPTNEPTLIDSEAMADVAGVSSQTIARLAKRGEIPSTKIGRRRKYRRDAVLAALEAMKGTMQ